MRYLIGALALLVLLAIIGLLLVWFGTYNVAATEPHSGFGRWVLNTTMVKSVRSRAAGEVGSPPAPTDAALEDGFHHFDDTCVQCHGAPGVDPAEWAEGLRPDPPDLAEEAEDWTEKEIFWIVKHGVRMTGMPAFGPTHSDEELWSMVRFVKTLPDMSAEEYRRLRAEAGAEPHTHHHH
ncbi:MAG TPA: cytochrome c [Woeseiaceae bacterium]|jgi:mono/diheme cytochrome c family protein|nr:cytochrome c [Woeseiaceae bacterium]